MSEFQQRLKRGEVPDTELFERLIADGVDCVSGKPEASGPNMVAVNSELVKRGLVSGTATIPLSAAVRKVARKIRAK